MEKQFTHVRMLLLCLALLLIALSYRSSGVLAAESAPGAAGDCSGNGSITAADVASARNHLFDNDGSFPTDCDANQDGMLTSADLGCIQRKVHGESCEPRNLHARLGTNLNAVVDWSPEYTFINAFKSSRFWTTRQSWGPWGPNQPELLTLDADGYPTSFPPSDTCAATYCWVTTFLFKDIDGNYPSGTYTVRFDGEGTLIFSGDTPTVSISDGEGSFTVTSPSNTGIEVNLWKTDPNGSGDHVRNIRVLMPGYSEGDEETDIFHSDFMASIAPFKTLRFMDWMRTNFSTQGAREAISFHRHVG